MQPTIEMNNLDPKNALGVADLQTLTSGNFCDKSHSGKAALSIEKGYDVYFFASILMKLFDINDPIATISITFFFAFGSLLKV